MLGSRFVRGTVENDSGGPFSRIVGVEVHDRVEEVGVRYQRSRNEKLAGKRHLSILAYHVADMVRVLTVNLYSSNSDPESLARVLDESEPDIVAAQELSPRAAAVLRSRFSYGFVKPTLNHRGAALVASTPIEVHRYPLPHRSALVGRFDSADGDRLTLWNVHMVNPAALPPPIGVRRRQMDALEEAISVCDSPLAVVGDFNATPVWPLYRRMTALLHDGVADWAQRSNNKPARTWAYRPGMTPLLRIDHVFVRDLVVTQARTIEVVGSDHRGLLVDLSRPEADGVG